MAAVAEFFKSTVTDNLAKLVQPSGLVPAAALVFLNLALIYPPALAEKRPVADQFGSLSSGWQALTIAIVIFGLGVVFFTIAGSNVDLLSGQTWRGSVIGRLGAWMERRRLKRLARDPWLARSRHARAWRITTQYPVSITGESIADIELVEPTRLGNALVAAQHQIRRRFGIDVAALGPQLQQAKDAKDAPALVVLRDERTSLDLLANLVVVTLILWLELVAFNVWRDEWDAVVLAYVLLPLAYLVYRLALVKALAWGSALVVLVDLHRAELRKALGLREPADANDERRLWERASSFYLFGGEPNPGDLFSKEVAPAVRVTTPGGLEATVVGSQLDNVPVLSGTGRVLRQLSYRLLIATKRASAALQGPIFIDDPRVDRLPATVNDEENGHVGEAVVLGDAHQGLRFELNAADDVRSLDLAYSVPLALVLSATSMTVTPDVAGTFLIGGHAGSLELELRGTSANLPLVQDGVQIVLAQPTAVGVQFVGLTPAADVYLVFPDARSYDELKTAAGS